MNSDNERKHATLLTKVNYLWSEYLITDFKLENTDSISLKNKYLKEHEEKFNSFLEANSKYIAFIKAKPC